MSTAQIDLLECVVSERTRWMFVSVHASDGYVGYGECSDVVGDVAGLLAEVAPVIAGVTNVDDVDGITSAVDAALTARSSLAERTVIGGVEHALCDLAARRTGQPLWKWLGGAPRTTVPLYANINRVPGGRRPDDVAAAGAAAVVDGFRTVKCAPFDTPLDGYPLPEAGLARLHALREAVGPEVSIYVDCHERLLVSDVVRILPELAALNIAWLEDATSCIDLTGLHQLRSASTIPLVGGELISSVDEIRPAIERDLLDVVMPDVKHAGGLLRTARIAQAVPEVQVSPHNPSGPIGTAVSAHLAAALPNFSVLEYAHGEAAWRSDVVSGAEIISAGHLHVVDGPGLGLDLATEHPALQRVTSLTVEEK